ncbi:MAG TPA: sodium:solute symporter family protein [Candidatus Dormibacteraeota bacterium]|nr:sodium:solute symporter family protein [Candidatus Dormibacteraeota bacterium]
MSAAAVASAVLCLIVATGAALGFYAGVHRKKNLEEWAVGGRGFGTLLIWLLMAGEVYTTFSFLGASGWAYSRGGPALYILGYLSLAYVVSFYILPQLWEVARAHKLQTQSDFFETRYKSKNLAAFVSIIGVVFLIPYIQLQLTGLGIIVEVASSGAVARTAATIIAAVVVAAFVFTSGIRAAAWVSVVKDILLLIAAVSIGIVVPYHYFHGIGPMFAAIARAHPAHLTMPGATKNLGHTWYISTVVLNSLGLYMWPHNFGASFTARSSDVLRRNAVVMPLYTITLPLIFLAGFAALMVVPGLSNGDLSLLTVVQRTFPPWALGVIGGAGALAAMVPASIFALTAATLFAKNFYRTIFAPTMSDARVAQLARVMVGFVMAIALYFAMHSSTTLVNLLLWGYDGITQFFPGVVLGLFWKRVTRAGVWSGMVAGIGILAVLLLSNNDPIWGVNAGFVALCVNFAVVASISLLTAAERSEFHEPFETSAEC